MADNTTCALSKKGNSSDPFHIGNTYGGIPTNLITNAIGWFFLMILFIFIRKSAFKYLRKRDPLGNLVNNTEQNMNRLISLFFTDPGPPFDSPGCRTNEALDVSVVAEEEADGEASPSVVSRRTLETVERRQSQMLLVADDNFWSWLVTVFTMTDRTMMELAGPDAIQYLRFQQYLIFFVLLTTILCICVILPFNFQGTLQGNAVDFGHTTLANLDPKTEPDSSYLFVHILSSFILFPISIFIMRRYSVGLKFRDAALEITHTLQIEKIPHHMCQEDLLRRHFTEAYNSITVKDLTIAFNVTSLTSLTAQLKDATDAKLYGERYLVREGRQLEMFPVCMARCFPCFCACCTEKVDVIEHYTAEEIRITREVQRETDLAVHNPLGMAFVTFNSINDSKKVFDEHTRAAFWCRTNPPMSSLSPSLRPERWKVSFAPPPRDIYWENLSDQKNWFKLKWVVANTILLLVALFLTTPEYIVTQLDVILIYIFGNEDSWQLPSLVKDFLPTLMLWSFTALLPVLVAYSDRWLGHWYRSEENHSIMIKSFWYLWVIVLIFPTFGFTTGMAVIENFFDPGVNRTEPVFRWDCIFLPDSGAFFVNYVITSAFIGSGLELIRFPELLWYGLQKVLSKSEAENPAIQRAVIMEFRFGEQYARMLLILSMVVMYSISCPLITPFGLVYFVLKHLVDKHNLALVYARSKINKNVHRSAINFVIFCVTLLQVFMVVFSYIRSIKPDQSISDLTMRTKVSLLLFVLTLMVFAAQTWAAFCRKMSPIKYEDVLYSDDGDQEDQVYLPEVLEGLQAARQEAARLEVCGADAGSSSSSSPNSEGQYGTFHPHPSTPPLVEVDAQED